jgi:hypothetical protein
VPSNAYSAEFRPDPALRRIVLGSGVASGLIGVLVIVTLPFPAASSGAGVVTWSALTIVQLRHLWRSWSACRGLSVRPGGEVAVYGPDGTWRRAVLASGGLLLRRWAWLRYRTASGRIGVELLRGCCRESQDWRRLQVIWRHIGAPASSC